LSIAKGKKNKKQKRDKKLKAQGYGLIDDTKT
jgi:hypothetical protein